MTLSRIARVVPGEYYVLSKGVESKEFESHKQFGGYSKMIPVSNYLYEDRVFLDDCIFVTNFSGCILAISIQCTDFQRSFLEVFKAFHETYKSYTNSTNFLLKNGESKYFVPPPYGMDIRVTVYDPSTTERFHSSRMSLESTIGYNIYFSMSKEGKVLVTKTQKDFQGRQDCDLINSTSHHLRVTLCTNRYSHPSRHNENNQDLGYMTIGPNGNRTLRVGTIDKQYKITGKIVRNKDIADKLSNGEDVINYQLGKNNESRPYVIIDASSGRTIVFFRKIVDDQGLSMLEAKSYDGGAVNLISNTNLVIK